MFKTAILTKKVYLSPGDLRREIKAPLAAALSKQIEGKCLAEGWVDPGSTQVLDFKLGVVDMTTGKTEYHVRFEVKVLFPTEGMELACRVTQATKMGILAIPTDLPQPTPLQILVPRDHYVNDSYYQSLQVSDAEFKARVIAQKFKFGDSSIFVLAEIIPPEAAAGGAGAELSAENSGRTFGSGSGGFGGGGETRTVTFDENAAPF